MRAAKTSSPVVLRTAMGVGRHFGKSDAWGRYAFKTGVVPTEFLIEGKQPAITEATLLKTAPSNSK